MSRLKTYLSSMSIHSNCSEIYDSNKMNVLRVAILLERTPALIAGMSTVSNSCTLPPSTTLVSWLVGFCWLGGTKPIPCLA